jgi:hypothetical protein
MKRLSRKTTKGFRDKFMAEIRVYNDHMGRDSCFVKPEHSIEIFRSWKLYVKITPNYIKYYSGHPGSKITSQIVERLIRSGNEYYYARKYGIPAYQIAKLKGEFDNLCMEI